MRYLFLAAIFACTSMQASAMVVEPEQKSAAPKPTAQKSTSTPSKPRAQRAPQVVQTKAPPSEESVRFCRAVLSGNFDMARLYLNKGADINCENCSQYSGSYTPLMHSVSRMGFAKFLIENGANVNYQNIDGVSALMLASQARQIETITMLVANGADASLKDHNGHDALFYLMGQFYVSQDPPLVRYLHSNGASINQQGNDGISPLMFWASRCDAEATKLFLSLGADPNLKTKLGETALMLVEKIAVNSSQGSTCNQTYSILSEPERYMATSSSRPIATGIPTSNNTHSTPSAGTANSVYSTYAGNYAGNYGGDDNGPFQVTVEQDGNIKLAGKSLRNNQAFTGNGKMNRDGSLGISLGNISTGATFQGSINPKTGALYGTWKNGEQAGNFSGSRQTAQTQAANPIEAIGGLLNVLNKVLTK